MVKFSSALSSQIQFQHSMLLVHALSNCWLPWAVYSNMCVCWCLLDILHLAMVWATKEINGITTTIIFFYIYFHWSVSMILNLFVKTDWPLSVTNLSYSKAVTTCFNNVKVLTRSINLDRRFLFRFGNFLVGEVASTCAHFAVPSC